MTAQPVLEAPLPPPADPVIQLPFPPPGGYTAADLDRIPNLPPHTELIDGGLFFVSPQKLFHTRAIKLLERGLERTIPPDLMVEREMSIKMGLQQRPEPDLVVVRREAETGPDQTFFPADAVVLAVEVVSPDSEVRDRERKPQLYAAAGIPHFWRVEDDGEGKIVLYTYELDPASRTYGIARICRGRIREELPFHIDIDLTEINQRKP